MDKEEEWFLKVIKTKSEDIYSVAVNRYSDNSLLYNMFISDKNKQSLSKEECKVFKDFIQLTLQAYFELEDKNPLFNFNFIRKIGGFDING